MSPQGRKVLELGTPLVPPCIFVCSPPPRSSPFTVIGAGLRSSLTHLRSSLASHRPPLRWFAAVLANLRIAWPRNSTLHAYSSLVPRLPLMAALSSYGSTAPFSWSFSAQN